MSHRAIAIDGPSGAGKSTLAKAISKELGFLYVDTGAIYRTVGLAALRQGFSPADESAVLALLLFSKKAPSNAASLVITTGYGTDGLQHMYLNREDVTEAIRQHAVSDAASQVSAIPGVRAYLLDMQRRFAQENDVVMDGRDIGTVVLPDAQVKIFLTADPADRARRRYEELLARGQEANLATILADVEARDYRDSHRAAAPLTQAPDAVRLDTTGLPFEESRKRLLTLVKEKLSL